MSTAQAQINMTPDQVLAMQRLIADANGMCAIDGTLEALISSWRLAPTTDQGLDAFAAADSSALSLIHI